VGKKETKLVATFTLKRQ